MLLSETIRFIIVLSFALCICLFEAKLVFNFIISKFSKKNKPIVLNKKAIIVHIIFFLGLLSFVYAFFIEPYSLTLTKVKIKTDKFKGEDLRIVHISDLHCDLKMRTEEKLIQVVNSHNPDLIVFTGDAINQPKALSLFKKTLKNLKSNIGKFAVTGNWDDNYFSQLDLFSDTGFRILDRECLVLDKDLNQFMLCGLGYKYFRDFSDCQKQMETDLYTIFLHHTPDLAENIDTSKIDLYLAGHTHRGQVALPFFGAIVTLSEFGKKYESGKYEIDNTVLYVSRGIGLEGGFAPKIRFFSRPEVVLLEINPR